LHIKVSEGHRVGHGLCSTFFDRDEVELIVDAPVVRHSVMRALLNTSCGWEGEALPTNTYAGDGETKFQTGYGTGYGNETGLQYGRNMAGFGANQRKLTTLTCGRAHGLGAACACGKAASLETSSPKTAQQIVQRMIHSSARSTPTIVIVRPGRTSSTLERLLLLKIFWPHVSSNTAAALALHASEAR